MSKIEWTDRTWNPVRGCSRVSPGCGGPNHEGGCYAEKFAARFSDPGQPYHGFAKRTKHGGAWTGKVALVEDKLLDPLRWRKPCRIFANSMSDLFHESMSDEAIDKVFAVMALSPQHTFQVLTKRPARMRAYFARHSHNEVELAAERIRPGEGTPFSPKHVFRWPLPNVWLGDSVEDQPRADERIPLLLETPAAVRFISAEPLLGPIQFRPYTLTERPCFVCEIEDSLNEPRGTQSHPINCGWRRDSGQPHSSGIDWVIVGGESGPGARPFDIGWARSIIAQCKAAGVACFVKQLGARPVEDRSHDMPEQPKDADPADVAAFAASFIRPIALRDRKGGDIAEWPEDLRVRQFPGDIS